MKAAFVLNKDGKLVSALVPDDALSPVHVGDRFLMTCDVDVTPYGTIPKGVVFHVFEVCPKTGDIGLECHVCGEMIVLMPFECDDALLDAMLIQQTTWQRWNVRLFSPSNDPPSYDVCAPGCST
jgi:hypothetical protein